MTPPIETPTASRREASNVLGISPARTRIIRLAVRNGRVTAQEIMDATGLSRSGVQNHVGPLVQAGVFIPDSAFHKGEGPANRLCWALDTAVLDELLDEYRAWLLGGDTNK